MHPYQHHRQSLQLQKGLENVYIRLYTGILNIRKVINPQSKKLQEGDSNQQCLIFARVKAADLAKIDDVRSSLGKHTRMTYYTDTDQLIIKLMPSAKHEKAHLNLAKMFNFKLARMGMAETSFDSVGAQRFEDSTSSKEVIQPTNLYLPEEETKTGQQSSLNLVHLSPYGDSESMQDGGLRILEVM